MKSGAIIINNYNKILSPMATYNDLMKGCHSFFKIDQDVQKIKFNLKVNFFSILKSRSSEKCHF